jgi:hypothetical protein
VICDPTNVEARDRGADAALHLEIIDAIGPEKTSGPDVAPAADHGVGDGHLLDARRPQTAVTGKPVELGGSLGRRGQPGAA